MANPRADLSEIVDDTAFNLSGQERGQFARAQLKLDEYDEGHCLVVLSVPESLAVLSPSFVQGLLAPTVRRYGSRMAFYERYKIEASDFMRKQIDSGVRRILALSKH